MREAIGGTWLFSIVVTFIALFTAFLAYAISYTKAFNTKSEILNLIERSEGFTISDNNVQELSNEQLKNDKSVESQAFLLIKNMGYNYESAQNADCNRIGHEGENAMQIGGYCVTRFSSSTESIINADGDTIENVSCSPGSKVYYKVTTFISVTLPVVNLNFSIPVSGETRTLFFDYGNDTELGCYKGGY